MLVIVYLRVGSVVRRPWIISFAAGDKNLGMV